MKREVKCSLDDLVNVFEFSSDEMTHYLNIETGRVAVYSNLSGGFDEEGNEIKNANAFDDDRYVEIVGMDPYEAILDMERFIETLSESKLKRNLKIVLRGKSSFRRFGRVLSSYPDEERNWANFRKERMLKRIYGWLEENDLELFQG